MPRKTVRTVSTTFLFATFLAGTQPLGAADAAHLEVPFHRQAKNGCGPASVAMLQSYWSARQAGLAPPSVKELYASLPVSSDQGTLLSDMRLYLDSRGYHAFTIQASPTDLIEQISKGRAPIVALKNNSNADLHYVVVTGLDQRRVWVNDPAKNKPGRVDRAKFEESWNRAGAWMLLAVPRKAKS